jgi:hypothetical protein
MDDAVEVRGLSAVQRIDHYAAEPHVWRPIGPDEPEPESLKLTLRYAGQEYEAIMARSIQGNKQLRLSDEVIDAWTSNHTGWWVRVWRNDGSLFSAPYPTLEAAIVGALSIPALLHSRNRRAK